MTDNICTIDERKKCVDGTQSELWKGIKNFQKYEISTFGNLKNKNTQKNINPSNRGGYLVVNISGDDF
uniref:NUMOD4 domain-containing protein n=1 Tax=viral metagenome TaxID=1070528 RepID=A0A6C0LJJ6_9ZZZZ